MKRREKKRILICFVMFLAIVGSVVSISTVYAEDTNTTKKINLDKNTYKVFRFRNPNNKVKWTISGKKYVKIVEVQGKKKNCVVVRTGKKTGTCVLKGKSGKKTYLWKIKVKEDKRNTKATLAKVEKTDTKLDVTVKISNRTEEQKEYGLSFYIEKLKNGQWKKVEMEEGYETESIAGIIPAKKSIKQMYKLGTCYNSADLKKGIYRISIEANFDKKSYSKVIFKV